MKNRIFTVPGGGIFSRLLQCGIIPLADYEFDNVHLRLSAFDESIKDDPEIKAAVDHITRHTSNMRMYGIERPYEHIISYVLNQHLDSSYEDYGFLPVGKFYGRNDPIELSSRLDDYKRVLRKLHIQNEIKTRVDSHCKDVNIDHNTLGVHVRLTTMILHDHIMPVHINDYFEAIDKELESGNYSNLYVATDNIESLVKMEERYNHIIRYYPNLLRLPTEYITNVGEYTWEYDMFYRKQFWQESFMETMTLARCGGLVCRESNFSNAAIVFSNTLNKIVRVTSNAT